MEQIKKQKIFLIQFISIIIIISAYIDIVLKIMLIFGYIMLFRQERWHKHLYIMLLMFLILSITSNIFKG